MYRTKVSPTAYRAGRYVGRHLYTCFTPLKHATDKLAGYMQQPSKQGQDRGMEAKLGNVSRLGSPPFRFAPVSSNYQ